MCLVGTYTIKRSDYCKSLVMNMFDIYIIYLQDYILHLMMKVCHAWNFTGSPVSWTLLRSLEMHITEGSNLILLLYFECKRHVTKKIFSLQINTGFKNMLHKAPALSGSVFVVEFRTKSRHLIATATDRYLLSI